ncbi:MAG: DUF115 domain-containing protein [Treponema sp.]|jgi:hypothetical protein|nr:DUF115 domain-containing protein [Treponema sp.]
MKHLNSKNMYVFSKSRTGEIVPALIQGNKPLHSMIDPKREAQRIVSEIRQDSFVICLGLGGGFIPQAVLEHSNAHVCVIDFDKDSINELFANKNYTELLKNERFSLLVDPSCEEIKTFILEQYKPALFGHLKTIPLRTRIDINIPLFDSAISSIKEAIEIVSRDYSVQAHFGKRMFSNIIRNVVTMNNNFFYKENMNIHKAAIVAAGPSLNTQLPLVAKLKQDGVIIISTDTALPVLAHNKIKPDIIVSIDCQHIGFRHFACTNERHLLKNIPIVFDITSPPVLIGFTTRPVFFSSGHPLARYIANNWKPLPFLDMSGVNVTYACLSLAEYLKIQHITFFGADFSYIKSESYARGTYMYPYFEKKQTRLLPLESQFSKFLYRTPFLPPEDSNANNKNYYETSTLRNYRKKLEEKISQMPAEFVCTKGLGAAVSINKEQIIENNRPLGFEQLSINPAPKNLSASEFLERYRDDIAALPPAGERENYFKRLNTKQIQIFTTLLPYMAWVRKRNPELNSRDLLEKTKHHCTAEINAVLQH